jgi:choline dehydrogenase
MSMEIARQPSLTGLVQSDLKRSAELDLAPRDESDATLDEFIRAYAFSFYHPSGSCAMGKVVDAELRVHGLANVRVADASVMPTELTGNLNAPTIMIGERVADLVASAV